MKVYKIIIGTHSYFVQGGHSVQSLKEIAGVLKLEYDKIEKTPLSPSQGIIYIWSIGELKDYLDENPS